MQISNNRNNIYIIILYRYEDDIPLILDSFFFLRKTIKIQHSRRHRRQRATIWRIRKIRVRRGHPYSVFVHSGKVGRDKSDARAGYGRRRSAILTRPSPTNARRRLIASWVQCYNLVLLYALSKTAIVILINFV